MPERRTPHASPDDPAQPPDLGAGSPSPAQDPAPIPGEPGAGEGTHPPQGALPLWEAGWEQVFERLDPESRQTLGVYLRTLARLPDIPSLDSQERHAIHSHVMARIRALLRAHLPPPEPPPDSPPPDPYAPLPVSGFFAPPQKPAPTGPPIILVPKAPPADPPPDYRRVLPEPLRLPVLHAALSFAILALLPSHPLAMPTAIGLAAAVIIYVQWLVDRIVIK